VTRRSASNLIRHRPTVARSTLRTRAASARDSRTLAQIDHTTVDLIVVDEVTRQPIGRPVLTLAIDVHTRLVTGFYLALDYPSTLRAGVCVAQSIFEKGAWVAERGIEVQWPPPASPVPFTFSMPENSIRPPSLDRSKILVSR
jgi:putative transposase